MTKNSLPPVLRRWRFVAAVVGVAALAGGGVLLAANSDPDTAMAFHNLPSTRVLDIRAASQVGPFSTPLGAKGTLEFEVPGLPDDATAVALNVTVTDGTHASFLVVYPNATTRPATSTVNWDSVNAVANTATVNVGADHSLQIYNDQGSVNVIVDLLGYYAPSPGSGGTQGPAGPGVAPAYFSATNNSQDVLPQFALLQFGTPGPVPVGITSDVARSVFTVAAAGVYKVSFSVLAVDDNQFTVVVNDGSVATDLVFGAVADQANEGSALLTLLAGNTFSLQHSSAGDITLAGPIAGGDPQINASIVIERQS